MLQDIPDTLWLSSGRSVRTYVSTRDAILFSLGPITVRWYGALFSGGFIIGYFIMQHLFKSNNYDTRDLDKMLLLIFAGTVIGARLAHCSIYAPDYYLSHPWTILMVWNGGLASHGGTLGVLLALWWFCHRSKYSFFKIADMLSIPTALVCTLIRIGNFFNSEIVGIPTNSNYGVIFTALGENFPRHPAQIYEAICYFIIFILLTLIYRVYKEKPCGFVFGLFITLVFTSRFFIENVKEEQADYSTSTALTVGQYLSLPFMIAGILIIFLSFVRSKKKGNRNVA